MITLRICDNWPAVLKLLDLPNSEPMRPIALRAIAEQYVPEVVDGLNNLPIKTVNGATVFIKDVAHVRDGFAPQTNVVLADGRKAAMFDKDRSNY